VVCRALAGYRAAHADARLRYVAFETVHEYLHILAEAARLVAPLGPRCAFVCAAAVSDFHVPPAELPEHKIGSRGGGGGGAGLELRLAPTPKALGLVRALARDAFVVSFKLETDPAALEPHARASLAAYGQDLVVANLLETRYAEVRFFPPGEHTEGHVSLEGRARGTEIEALIAGEIAARHSERTVIPQLK
jgi:phosphopantothenate-cysteine ligase